MVQNADRIGTLVTTSGDARVTKVGRILRKYRLDELPQIFNVLAGSMTFVGTRPEVQKLSLIHIYRGGEEQCMSVYTAIFLRKASDSRILRAIQAATIP